MIMSEAGYSASLTSQRRHSKLSKYEGTPKLIFTGNFTENQRHFDITTDKESLRQEILNTVLMKTQKMAIGDDNPLYEDPRDVIDKKPIKPPRKRHIHTVAITSPRVKDKSIKDQKKKLSKKYEGLVTALMDKCEENLAAISEKDTQISKLKEKLKAVLEYNRLFSDENDRVKSEYDAIVKYVEECKRVIKEEKEKRIELERKSKRLEEKIRQFDMPDRENTEATAIPLVEVCMNCSSRQIVLNQSREHNSRLQKDLQAMKDVLYRLNVQLSRYQEKLRSNVQTVAIDGKEIKPEKYDGLDSILTASFVLKPEEEGAQSTGDGNTRRLVDLTGLLSAQALAPLFDAYQENLQEKDNLIMDYEKQFENINKKSKQIVQENKSLTDKVRSLEQELVEVRQSYKKVMCEKETGDIERVSLLERAEKAESKLKEVYELYEDKMAAMMRDYETVHREYFTVKSALEASSGKMAALDALRARTVPADLHERRLLDCKRLLEELKHQYSMDTERRSEQLKKSQEELQISQQKYEEMCQQHATVKQELKAALKNVKLYRRAALVFRSRARSASARATRIKRRDSAQEPLKAALTALEKIKSEIKVVKSRAYSSLEELERRIVSQERRAAHAQAEHARALERAALALQHKEDIIRSLIDKVADVEEVRLSQTNAHRLQGIVSSSSSSRTSEEQARKLVPGPGGYFQEESRKGKS